MANIFDFAGHVVPASTTQLCCYSASTTCEGIGVGVFQ